MPILDKQDFKDAKRDIEDIGKAVNTEAIIKPRWGVAFRSIPLVSKDWLAKMSVFESNANQLIEDLKQAIKDAEEGGAGEAGWTDSLIKTWSNRLQSDKNKELVNAQDFGAKGDGATNDTQAFTSLESGYTGRIVDLLGKTYLVDNDFSKNHYVNGFLKVNKLIIDKKLHSKIDLTKVRVERDFKTFHADTLSICTQYGYTRLFPQGFFIDAENDQIFIFCNRDSATDIKNNWGWSVVYQYSTGNFVSAFAGIPTSWVEGAFVTTYNNVRYLIAPFSEATNTSTSSNAFANNGLGVWALPSNLTTIHNTFNAPTKTILKVGEEYLGTNRILLDGTDVYVIKSATKVNGSEQSGLLFKLADVIDSETPQMVGSFSYEEVSSQSKAQGCDIGENFYGVGYGRNTGSTYINGEFDAKNHGLVLYAKNGAVVNSAFFDHKSYSSKILTHIDKRTDVTYSGNMENEGMAFVKRGQNEVINVLEIATYNITGQTVQGCHPVVLAYDATYSDTEDLSAISSSAHSRSWGEYSDKVVKTTQPKNPFTFESFTSITEIANYAIGAGLSEYSFYHSSPTITDVDGNNFPPYSWVTLLLNNFSTMFLRVHGVTNYTRTVKLEGGVLVEVAPSTYKMLGTTASNAQMQFTLKNINREGGIQINASGQIGLFDYTNSKWLVSSPIAGDVLYLNAKVATYGDTYPFNTNTYSLGTSSRYWTNTFTNSVTLQGGITVSIGSGNPDGVKDGVIGSMYIDNTTGDWYQKKSVAGTLTGWTLK